MLNKDSFSIDITVKDANKLVATIVSTDSAEEGLEYAFYVYKNETIIERFSYSEKNVSTFWLSESGNYHVVVYAKDKEGNKATKTSEEIEFNIEKAFTIEDKKQPKISIFDRVKEITKELIDNIVILFRIALYDYKLENKDTYLGRLWSVLTPLIQIGTYWFVFGVGLRSGRDIDGFPYLAWMLCGIIPWFFMSGGITKGANAIYAKVSAFSKMKFCIASAPVSKVVQEMLGIVMMMVILLVCLIGIGIMPSIYWFNLVYYIVYSFVFLIGLSMITSVLTMVARDFYKLLTSLIRLLFYLTPILWDMSSMPLLFQQIMRYNPIYYMVKGFRNSILYQISFYEELDLLIVMWVLNILLYVGGCVLQSKFKNKFIDLI